MDMGGEMNGNHYPMGAMTPDNGMDMNMDHKKMMMHMTFFWGKNAEILFSGWPGTSLGMYILSLIVVFIFSLFLEWLSNCHLIRPATPHVAAGLMQTALHTARMGLSYLVMLAVMSFNVGVFIAAVVGHSVGFLLFGSRAFKRSPVSETSPPTDLPPMKC